jgi:hypothetical protein
MHAGFQQIDMLAQDSLQSRLQQRFLWIWY